MSLSLLVRKNCSYQFYSKITCFISFISEDIPESEDESCKLEETDKPEVDLMKILQKLSPEKLQQIKKTLLDESEKMEVDTSFEAQECLDDDSKTSSPKPEQSSETKPKVEEAKVDRPATPKIVNFKPTDDDIVILLDSDEDEPPTTAQSSKSPEPVVTITLEKTAPSMELKEADEKSSSDDKKNGHSIKRATECINSECSKESQDFQICPLFALNFYYISKKPNKDQHICENCFEKAVIKYEVN